MGRGSGIDYGSHSFKVADVRASGGKVSVRGITWLPAGGGRGGLPAGLGEQGLRLRRGMLGVSGRDSILRYTHVPPVPPWRLKMIMDYEIEEIASKGGENISADYQVLNVPRDVNSDLTILVGMAKDEQVTRRLDDLAATGIAANGACPTSLGLFGAYRALGEPVDDAALLIDIGHENMDIAISHAGHLIFARSVQLGGKDFTEAIASHLEVSPEEAETLKHEKGAIQREGWESPRHRKIADALMTVVANVLSVVQSSVKFCRAQTKISDLNIERVFLSGGGARLRGLPEHLAEALKLPVDIFDPLAAADTSALPEEGRRIAEERGTELAVAVGLGLIAAEKDAFRLDLLPSAMKAKREFRSRTAFLYAAAGLAAVVCVANLGWAITVRVGETGRRATLKDIRAEVSDRFLALNELNEENDRLMADIEAIAAETRPGYFLAHLMDALGASTPEKISVSQVRLVGAETDHAGRPFTYEVAGSADDATGDAFDHARRFVEALRAVPQFSRVRLDPTRTEQDDKAGVLRFVIVVTPGTGA